MEDGLLRRRRIRIIVPKLLKGHWSSPFTVTGKVKLVSYLVNICVLAQLKLLIRTIPNNVYSKKPV